MPERLVLNCRLSPGDIMTLTATVETLHRRYPGRFLTDVKSPCGAIWENNPNVTSLQPNRRTRTIEMEYPSVNRSNQEHLAFLAGYAEFLSRHLELPLPLSTNRPHLYLSEEERGWVNQITQHFTGGRNRPFWLVSAGVKLDFTAKQWPVEHYQEVVERTRGLVQWVQVGEESHRHHRLQGVIDLVGMTDLRQLIRLAYHAQGGLGPVTLLQHLMAAWEKPYICLLGGREPVPWVAYPKQHTLHAIGQLPCCRNGACWRSRVVPLEDGDGKDKSLCDWPVLGGIEAVAKCMAMIRPQEVTSLVERLACAYS